MRNYISLLRNVLLIALTVLSATLAFADNEFCWKDSYGRGVGTIPTQCAAGQENQAGLCYKTCNTGYSGVGPVCWSACPAGYTDMGAVCHINKALTQDVSWECTAWWPGWMGGACRWKDSRCPADYTNVGLFCALTSAGKSAPAGFSGTFLDPMKNSYGRGAGTIPTGCDSSKENDAGLCYSKCNAGYAGVGPVCWGQAPTLGTPPTKWVECGMGAAASSKVCGSIIFDQVSSVGTLALTIGSMGSSTALTAGMSAPEKATRLAKLKQQYSEMKVAFELLKKNNKNIVTAYERAGDLKTLYDANESAKDAVTEEDMARVAASIASILDPTGASATVAAYTYPKCSKYVSAASTPAPTPTPTPVATTLSWTEMGGAAVDIGVGANGTVWVTNAGGNIYRWTGSAWTQMPGGASRVAVDPQGNAWVLNSAGGIYLWKGSTWEQKPGGLSDIGVGANGTVWGVNSAGNIYRWTGSTWTQMPGGASRVSVDPKGNAWVVNSAGGIYLWTGSTWVQKPGAAKDVAACHNGDVYVIGTDNAPYKWNGSNWDKKSGPALLNIACDAQGKLYGTTTSQSIQRTN